jgi:DNA-binding XRE family transcriptional regulator
VRTFDKAVRPRLRSAHAAHHSLRPIQLGGRAIRRSSLPRLGMGSRSRLCLRRRPPSRLVRALQCAPRPLRSRRVLRHVATSSRLPRKLRQSRRTLSPRVAFGLALRALRQKAKHSQDSFAQLTGFHRNYIGQLERGEKSPSLNALFIFGKSLGILPSEILELVQEKMSR